MLTYCRGGSSEHCLQEHDVLSAYQGDEYRCALPIPHIVLTEKVDEELFLLDNHSSEKFPEDDTVGQKAALIAEDQ